MNSCNGLRHFARVHDRRLLHGHAVHQPGRYVASLDLTPNEVDFAIAVEVTQADNLPSERHARGYHGSLAHGHAVHQPGGHIAGLGLTPYQVRSTVSMQIPNSYNLPR